MDSDVLEFVELLGKAGIVPRAKVVAVRSSVSLQKSSAGLENLTSELMSSGVLTQFQASEVCKGKTQTLVVGEYVLLDHIGKGGMGQVFKARHLLMKRDVAIKFMLPREDDTESTERFRREVQTASKLSHPNVVAALDAGQREGVSFLVMEYVAGQNLAELVRSQGPMNIRRAADCVLQAAQGLEYAHRQGVVHRDIKPSNLLISADGATKILDMGLARMDSCVELSSVPDETDDKLTRCGQILGTVDFMAPEQALDPRHVDKRADIYSLGCTLFYLLTGERPYPGDSTTHRIIAHRETPIPSLRESRPEVPKRLDRILRRMLAKQPKNRYQDMSDVITDLRTCCHEFTSMDGRLTETVALTDYQHGRPHWPRSTMVGILGVLACLALITAVVWGFLNTGGNGDGAGPLTETVNLLESTDLDRNWSTGSGWDLSESGLSTGVGRAARLQFVHRRLPDEYTLRAQVTRREGTGPLVIGLVIGDHQCYLLLDRDGKSGIGMNLNDGLDQQTAIVSLPPDQAVSIFCRIRPAEICVDLGGEEVIHWEGDFADLKLGDGWKVNDQQSLFIGTNNNTVFQISELAVSPPRGSSK